MKQTVPLAALPSFCQKLAASWGERQLVLLQGPLGAGKTQFVKSAVRFLGGEMPDSPTFSLINEYKTAGRPVWHVDLYRLESESDIESTGFWDLFRETRGLIFVEWPERVPASSWPLPWKRQTVSVAFGAKADERVFDVSDF